MRALRSHPLTAAAGGASDSALVGLPAVVNYVEELKGSSAHRHVRVDDPKLPLRDAHPWRRQEPAHRAEAGLFTAAHKTDHSYELHDGVVLREMVEDQSVEWLQKMEAMPGLASLGHWGVALLGVGPCYVRALARLYDKQTFAVQKTCYCVLPPGTRTSTTIAPAQAS